MYICIVIKYVFVVLKSVCWNCEWVSKIILFFQYTFYIGVCNRQIYHKDPIGILRDYITGNIVYIVSVQYTSALVSHMVPRAPPEMSLSTEPWVISEYR